MALVCEDWSSSILLPLWLQFRKEPKRKFGFFFLINTIFVKCFNEIKSIISLKASFAISKKIINPSRSN